MKHLLPEFWQRGDILANYAERIDYSQLELLRQERWSVLQRAHWVEFRSLRGSLPSSDDLLSRRDYQVGSKNGWMHFGNRETLSTNEQEILCKLLRLLMPWRKGPYNVCGVEVDAEWRSDYKWERVVPFLPELKNKMVVDIGCSNGYYMFRALEHKPWSVLGIDPSEKFLFAFELFQKFGNFKNLQYELLKVQEMGIFRELFDVAFCFGILYHHRDPFGVIKSVAHSLKPGGDLLVESQAIPGEQPYALCPADRYAKQRNVYFIPTASCIESWLKKSGFVNVETVSSVEIKHEEQRRTDWMQFESLESYLDPDNPDKTIEGYDAPIRVIIRAKKRH